MSKHTKFPGPAILVPLDMDNFNVFTPPRDVLPGKRRNPSLHVFGTVIYSILTRQHPPEPVWSVWWALTVRYLQRLSKAVESHSILVRPWPVVSECEEHGPAVLLCTIVY